MRRRVLEAGYGYELVGGGIIGIVCNDLQKNEITANMFETVEELCEWQHAASLSMIPWWHKEHCQRCIDALTRPETHT